MLKSEQWSQLSEYYDLSQSQLKPADLASDSFFIHRDTNAVAQPIEVTRYKHPFPPAAELQSLIRTTDPDIVVLEMAVSIDQGAGAPVQRELSWFMMKRVANGWKILPDHPTPAQTQACSAFECGACAVTFSAQGACPMRSITLAVALLVLCFTLSACVTRPGDATSPQWRALPLIKEGKVHPDWKHTGFGALVVDADSLRTEADGRGLGLLVFSKEKFGDCRLRVVYRVKDARANSGVYVRIDDGILRELGKQQIAVQRDADGKLSEAEVEKMMEASEKEQGPWYAVHHGYEVQIADGGNEMHGTGAIYSLANRTGKPIKPPGEWRTMIITLRGTRVEVELDGVLMSTFDSASSDLPPRKAWHEPKREPVRPTHGYIGVQTHDPGEVVWFREISVAQLEEPR